ncbi:nucleoside-diphosphate sugar epimerase/dehydratase [Oricola sp.]|uniref:nucleoside-diphosphate sugar epimerase/dehydratase n=1 Tax=Oricola sp. TaxID=1979950 RepID=UPI0025EC4E4B|nr:nucleoside-diphosphate sugar epimerase/dehydratase [Oricola sp.]MCI5073589.1 polysaccharide biosynthesis protein [Oricola sp.]
MSKNVNSIPTPESRPEGAEESRPAGLALIDLFFGAETIVMIGVSLQTRLIEYTQRLSRREKQIIQIVVDAGILWIAAYGAFVLRLGLQSPLNSAQLAMIVVAPCVAVPVFIRSGLYRMVLRFLPEKAFLTIFRAVVISALIWTALAFFSGSYGGSGVPRTVPFIFGILALFGIGISRFAAKWILLNSARNAGTRRILIYGAGRSGNALAHAMQEAGVAEVLGFLDDDAKLHARNLGGIRVYDPTNLKQLVDILGIDEIVLSIPSASTEEKLRVGALVADLPVSVRILPASSGLSSGRFDVQMLEKLDIAQLIGRSAVPPDRELLDKVVRGKRILITGAGGSIGAHLARLIDQHAPSELILLDNSEYALYRVWNSLHNARQFYPAHTILGSVAEKGFMMRLMATHTIDVIFHAAAFKHVDLVEQNTREAVRNNVYGTRNVLDAAFETGVKSVVLISTDKAVNPTSVMGATKRLSELSLRSYADRAELERTGQKFLTVRFGNVIGSSGSVVPLFREQIARGGPVTVTHRDVSRYFMAASEAVELIVQSAALSQGGETFVLDMGEPVKIHQLARDMVRLAGLAVRDEKHPDGDIEIKFTDLRPGEKLSEQLWYDINAIEKTGHPKIMMVKRRTDAGRHISEALDTLETALDELDEGALRDLVFDLISGLNGDRSEPRVVAFPHRQ